MKYNNKFKIEKNNSKIIETKYLNLPYTEAVDVLYPGGTDRYRSYLDSGNSNFFRDGHQYTPSNRNELSVLCLDLFTALYRGGYPVESWWDGGCKYISKTIKKADIIFEEGKLSFRQSFSGRGIVKLKLREKKTKHTDCLYSGKSLITPALRRKINIQYVGSRSSRMFEEGSTIDYPIKEDYENLEKICNAYLTGLTPTRCRIKLGRRLIRLWPVKNYKVYDRRYRK